ncbi:uncharacterized protein RCC_05373 [Ramularia collo-cygni]|uniref:Uncharacterized protein n=1 Tax=Ramularia collo-cygni TaxID=112498 RepID=A0A2D3UR47_9PEZI|nr:uncharacterized protein RCC_05373 [Ramularia collo-cygni]CZT19522.1 uncharacterized protein RCC_05373 [Ramularia collo-cygni]
MARLRKAPASQAQTQPPASITRRALKEKTNTAVNSPAPRYEDDGNAEAMVKDAKPRRGRTRKQTRQDSDDLLMAGAIGPSDEPAPPSDVPTTTDELAKSDSATAPAAKGNRRPARTIRKVAQSEAQTKVLEGLKQRMAATARGQRVQEAPRTEPIDPVASSDSFPAIAPARKTALRKSNDIVPERSEFSLSPSPPPPGKLSTVQGKRSSLTQPGSVLRNQSTPAVETSILALKNFKRRPRQPSMLAMVQQRTASARPSAAHTDLAIEDSSMFDLELDDEDDFAPEAEGTPLNVAKNKRKSTASTGLRAKRRKSTIDDTQDNTGGEPFVTADEIVVAVPSSSQRAETPQPAATSDAHNAQVPSSSTPPTEPSFAAGSLGAKSADVMVPSTEREQSEREQSVAIPSTERSSGSRRGAKRIARVGTIDADESGIDTPNGTMAEPASSSPAQEEMRNTQYNTDMADPVTQISPVRSRAKAAKKQKPVSTATLQSLLPKRRKILKPRQRKSEYDMASDSEDEEDVVLDVSHLENDEDELGGETRRRAPSKARGKTSTRKSGAGKKVAAHAARQSTVARSREAAELSIAQGRRRTYGRDAIADKENDEEFEAFEDADESILPEECISMHDAIRGKELEQAKRIFAEVDDWDMEFESMSQEDHGSSSQGWR